MDRGKENAIPGKDIARVLGVDLRTITKAIEQERRAGTPICANCDIERGQQGYYLPANQEELDEYCNSLKRRAIEIFKTRQAILKANKTARERIQ